MPHVLSNTTSKRRRLLTLLLSLAVALAGVVLAPAAHADPPFPVSGVTATTSSGSVTLNFSDFSFASPPNSYEGSATLDGSLDFRPFDTLNTADGFTFDGTLSGLTNGKTYTVYVRAVNADGVSDPAFPGNDGRVYIDGPPPAPTIGTAAVVGTGAASVSFQPPTPDGTSPVTGYTATSDPDGISVTCEQSPCMVSNLRGGTSYTFTVAAQNDLGTGVSSEASNAILAIDVPYAPRSIARVGATPVTATVSFLQPIFSGVAVSGYQVSSNNGSSWRGVSTRVAGSRRVATATGLRSGVRYSIRVRAVNALGVGASSAAITILTAPATVVARPAARAGTSAALVTWRASTQREVFGYLVTSSRGARCYTYTRTETSCIIGNTAGMRTFYRVYARSAAGTSFASAASNTVRSSSPSVPSRVPGVPNGFAYRSSKVKSGKTATLTARGFLPSSSVVLVAYGAKRYIVKRFVTTRTGSFIAKVRMPKDKAKSLTFVAFGSTPYGSSKAIGTSIRRA